MRYELHPPRLNKGLENSLDERYRTIVDDAFALHHHNEVDVTCNPVVYSLSNLIAIGDPKLLKPVNCSLLPPNELDVLNVASQINDIEDINN